MLAMLAAPVGVAAQTPTSAPVTRLTRDEALPRLRNLVVALVTRTIRGIDTEVELGPADGMPIACAVGLDNLRAVLQALLSESITRRDAERMDAFCRALNRAAGC